MPRHYGPVSGGRKSIVKMLPKDARPHRIGSFLIVILIVAIFAAMVTVAWYWTFYRDAWAGAFSPEAAAAGWVNGLNGHDDASLSRYLLPSARDSGIMADVYDINAIRQLHEERHMVFGSVSVGDPELLGDDELARVRSGLSEFYGSDDDVSSVANVTVLAEMSWTSNAWAGDSKPVLIPVTCVERHGKWYVYTATPLDGGSVDGLSIDGSPEEASPAVEPTPFVRDRRPVMPSDSAAIELSDGLVEIEGASIRLPCGLDEMAGLFSVTDDGLDLLINPNGLVDHVPLAMADESYGAAWIYVGVANPGDTPCTVRDGILCRLWIGLPLDGFSAYPEVYLPGDVTLGSTYDDVVSVYGELSPCNDTDRVEAWSAGIEIYALPFGGSVHNRIYLEFSDGILSAIGWDYYDFNSYNGDLS